MICKNIFIYFSFILLFFTNLNAIDNTILKTEQNKIDLINLTPEEREFLIKTKINCVVSTNWVPFNFIENNKLSGISLDYWELIKKKTLIESTCKGVLSSKKSLELLKNKKADIVLSSSVSEKNITYGMFSLPYASYPLAIATTNDKRYISDISILNGKKIALGSSNTIFNLLKNKYPQIDFIQVNNNLQALRQLSRDDVFAVIDVLPVLSQAIVDYGFKNIKISGTTEFNFELRIMVRNDYKKLLPIINKGIIAIKKEEVQEIKKRWFSAKVEKVVELQYLWETISVIVFFIFILFYRQLILNKHNKKLQQANDKIEQKSFELQKKTQELIKQKMLFEKIYYESADGIIILKADDKTIIDCNQSAYKLLEYETKTEFLIENISNFFPEYQPDKFKSNERFNEMIEIAIKKGSNFVEWVHKTKTGKNLWFEVVITSLEINNENILHMVWRNIDNRKKIEQKLNELTHTLEERIETEIKKNEEKTNQLMQQSRLAQMGEMISMIAHQWRQPLTAISATANNMLIRFMIDEKMDKETIQDELTLISNYSQHLSSTIDDFRNFFKTDKKKIEITIESIIENSISILNNSLISNDISLYKDYQCNRKLILNSTEINQVILNLIKNAEDALIENKIESAKIGIKTFCDEDAIYIEINDNAKGIPDNIINKIFDPYFSTKSEKDGTGLGLYMSKIIINDHCQGNLGVKSSSLGTTFTIKLPIIKH